MEMTNDEAIALLERAADRGDAMLEMAEICPTEARAIVRLLKAQEPVEPHYTTLKYLVNGTEVIVHHPECPRCIKNGLALWDAEIEKGQVYCKRCGQAVKWNE